MADSRAAMASRPVTGGFNVTETPRQSSKSTSINISEEERWASLIGGGALMLYGLRQGSLCGLAWAATGGALVYRGITQHCDIYAALGISTAETHGPATSIPAGHGIKIEKTVIINRSAHDLFQFWRRFENLPRFMSHLESITTHGRRSHWVSRAPLGTSVEWDAEIINEKDNELIAWRSLEDADVDSAGSVHFDRAPVGSGTKVTVVLKYDPPAGKLGAGLARLFGEDPEQQIEEDLRRFKQFMEAGDTHYAAATPSGSRKRESLGS